MKVRKGLKEFIKEKMIFKNYSGVRQLEIKEGLAKTLGYLDYRKAISLHQVYRNRRRSETKSMPIPIIVPGLLIELECGERYLVVHDPLCFERDYLSGYLMLGKDKLLNTIMFDSRTLYPSQLFPDKEKDSSISKIYRLTDEFPGTRILENDVCINSFGKLLWKRR